MTGAMFVMLKNGDCKKHIIKLKYTCRKDLFELMVVMN